VPVRLRAAQTQLGAQHDHSTAATTVAAGADKAIAAGMKKAFAKSFTVTSSTISKTPSGKAAAAAAAAAVVAAVPVIAATAGAAAVPHSDEDLLDRLTQRFAVARFLAQWQHRGTVPGDWHVVMPQSWFDRWSQWVGGFSLRDDVLPCRRLLQARGTLDLGMDDTDVRALYPALAQAAADGAEAEAPGPIDYYELLDTIATASDSTASTPQRQASGSGPLGAVGTVGEYGVLFDWVPGYPQPPSSAFALVRAAMPSATPAAAAAAAAAAEAPAAPAGGQAVARLRANLAENEGIVLMPKEAAAFLGDRHGSRYVAIPRAVLPLPLDDGDDAMGRTAAGVPEGIVDLYPHLGRFRTQMPAAASITTAASTSRHCSFCDSAGETSRCSACKSTWYCSASCQRNHWDVAHKQECKRLAERQAESAATTGGGGGGGSSGGTSGAAATTLSALAAPAGSSLATQPGSRARRTRSRGLQNIGNTCFMNASLQCLTAVWPLTNYFAGGKWEEERNDSNPLGSGGRLATAYADLVRELWFSPSSYAVVPSDFKRQLGMFKDRFNGFMQHDAQELLNFVLDGLHEDVNRVKKKPYVEDEDCKGRTDAVFSRVSWDKYKLRNDSRVLDLFMGQLKSTLVCPRCQGVSVKFDPYSTLTLPIATPPPVFSLLLERQRVALDDIIRGGVGGSWPPTAEEATAHSLEHDRNRRNQSSAVNGGGSEAADKDEGVSPRFELYRLAGLRGTDSHADLYTAAALATGLPRERLFVYVWVKQGDMTHRIEDDASKSIDHFLQDILRSGRSGPRVNLRSVNFYAAEVLPASSDAITLMIANSVGEAVDPSEAIGQEEAEELKREQSMEYNKTWFDDLSPDDQTAFGRFVRESAFPSPPHFVSVPKSASVATARFSIAAQLYPSVSETFADIARNLRVMDVKRRRAGATPSQGRAAPLGAQALEALAKKCPVTPLEGTYWLARTLPLLLLERRDPKMLECFDNWSSGDPNQDADLDMRKAALGDAVRTTVMESSVRRTGPSTRAASSRDALHFATGFACWHGAFRSACDTDRINSARTCRSAALRPGAPEEEEEKEDMEQQGGSHGASLLDCWDTFSRAEVLDEENAWYCPTCKDHVMASKKMDVWSLPEILVVQLKRFSGTTRKAGDLVDFPLVGLDLTDRCLQYRAASEIGKDSKDRAIYDCCGVVNHFGSLMFGHYTAYTNAAVFREQDPSTFASEWTLYDDSSVEPDVDPSAVVSEAAYVLFYRKRPSGTAM
jgi:ubiquitin C-terminal hydrolase